MSRKQDNNKIIRYYKDQTGETEIDMKKVAKFAIENRLTVIPPLHLWIDIDEAPRKHIHKSLIARREQMVGDGLHLTLDADHWNNIHPAEEPIVMPLDFTDDIEWRKNAPDEDKKAA